VDAASERVAGRIEAMLRSAAAESRLPGRRLRRILLTGEEKRGIAVRLGSGGALLVDALDQMESTVRKTARGGEHGETWRTELARVARQLESAWVALEAAAAREEAAWREDAADVRAWRRKLWPLWLISLAVVLLLGWTALVLGGFLDAPGWFRPVADWWWIRT
jgi:hypothetical protein